MYMYMYIVPLFLLGYQLMTLSRDRTLRTWPISEQLSSNLGAVAIETDGPCEDTSIVEASLSSRAEMETTFTNVQVREQLHEHYM